MKRIFSPILALALFLGAVGLAGAADIRFELGFGWTLVAPRMNATYVSQYTPVLVPQERFVAGTLAQTLRFKGKTAYGFNGFFNLFLTENFGLQVLADYHRPGIGGDNSDYAGEVQFLDYNDEVATVELSRPWESSAGNLSETTFSFNALARFRIARDLHLSVSAGPTVFNFEGKIGYIGYTELDLVVDESSYDLSGMTYMTIASLEPRTKYGFNLGLEGAYEIMRHVILALDLRWYQGASADVQMHIVDDELYPRPAAEIEQALNLGTVKVNPSYMRAGLAIRFIF
jgi:hypothetical protein